MSDRAAVAGLVTAAARKHLHPLGLQQKGRSRTWFDDHGWCLITVEFQPGSNVGTYLNIGATWLWNDFYHLSFDEGSRLYWRDDGTFNADAPIGERGWNQFARFINADQVAQDIDLVAQVAKARVEELRDQFPDPCTAARRLGERPTRIGESQRWHAYHIGAAAGLCGDPVAARAAWSQIKIEWSGAEGATDLDRLVARLTELADDHVALRNRIIEMIHSKRDHLGLPPTPLQ